MKKYIYETIEYKMKKAGMAAAFYEHREIIEAYADKGYRYVGIIPVEMKTNGCIRKADLIFEKEN